MNGIDRLARLLASGAGRRAVLSALVAAAVRPRAARAIHEVPRCSIPQCLLPVGPCSAGERYGIDHVGTCACIPVDCDASTCLDGCCDASGECRHDPAADGLCGTGGAACRACRKGRRCRADGTCGRRPRVRR